MRRLTSGTFVLLAVLHTAPLWTVRYLPLGDGPSHVYNAWILHGLATGSAPAPIRDAFAVDWRPHLNWSSHLLLALAMTVAPPLIAEKLFLALLLAALSRTARPVTLELEAAGHAKIWAFVTEGDKEGRTRVVQPR